MDVDEVVATMDGKVSAKEATARFELEVCFKKEKRKRRSFI